MMEIKVKIYDSNSSLVYRKYASVLAGPNDSIVQYTGLEDKNGAEVYEHDIIQKNGAHFLVIWNDNDLMWQAKPLSQRCDVGNPLNEFYDCEVIGNIYEGVNATVEVNGEAIS